MTNRKCGQQRRRTVKLKTNAKNGKLKNYPKCFRGGLRKMISMAQETGPNMLKMTKHAQHKKLPDMMKRAAFFFFNVERNNIKVNKNAYQKWHIRCKVGQS